MTQPRCDCGWIISGSMPMPIISPIKLEFFVLQIIQRVQITIQPFHFAIFRFGRISLSGYFALEILQKHYGEPAQCTGDLTVTSARLSAMVRWGRRPLKGRRNDVGIVLARPAASPAKQTGIVNVAAIRRWVAAIRRWGSGSGPKWRPEREPSAELREMCTQSLRRGGVERWQIPRILDPPTDPRRPAPSLEVAPQMLSRL